MKKFGRFVAKHPVVTLLTWVIISVSVVAVAVVGIFGENLFDRLSNSTPTVSSDSQTANDLIEAESDSLEYKETILLLIEGTDVHNASLESSFEDLIKSVDDIGGEIVTPYLVPEEVLSQTPELNDLVTDESFISIITVESDDKDTKREMVDEAHIALDSFKQDVEDNSIQVTFGGETKIVESISHQAEQDLTKGELISLPISLLVLLFIFGGFLAAGMPLLGAMVSIVSALGTLFGLSYLMDVDTTVLNVLTVIGLGLSIDYGLLMVSRMREVLRKHKAFNKEDIIERVAETVSTAGRTVLFSGITVAVATASLFLFEPAIMKNIAIAASTVVLLAVFASITLLPALFSLLGNRLIKPSIIQRIPGIGNLLSKFGDVAPSRGFFSKMAGIVQKRPLLYTLAASGSLLILAGSVINLNISNDAVNILSDKTEQGRLLNVIDKDFPSLAASDITVVIESTNEDNISDYFEYINDVHYVTDIESPRIMDEITVISVNVSDSHDREVVESMRNHFASLGAEEKVYLTGSAAQDIDYVASLAGTAPWVALIIIFTTGLLLFLMTGSLIVPLKAIILSALSLGASVGVLVWGFEKGNLSGLLGFNPADITAIDPLILVLVLVFGFGLAMDYEMFLISRIKEKHEHGASTLLSVRTGLQASGRIITSAALIIILVFMGFALGEMLMIKQIGVALAVAVFIDATLVRLLLMPALISLLGDRIWWAPTWMKKMHEKIGIQH